jgi:SAM-dependent methyltransferase
MIENRMKESLKMAYNEKAADRDNLESQEWKEKERETFLTLLLNEQKRRVLEIGAGPGRDAKYFQDRGLQVTATDLSPEMVKLCKEKGIEAYEMSFDNLQFPSESFDAVWALNCLLHVPKANLPNVLKEIHRVLQKDGLFFIGVYGGTDSEGVWEGDFYQPKRFFSFFSHERIKEAVSEVFSIESFSVVSHEIIGGQFDFQAIVLRKKGD